MSKVPQGWARCQLGDYARLKNGFAFKSTAYTEISSETVPVIRISDINQKIASDVTASHVHVTDAAPGFEIRRGDLLIAMSGATTGKFGIYGGAEPAYQNQRVGNIKLIDPHLGIPSFRNYLVASLSQEIYKTAYGGAQPNISGGDIEQLEIFLPPLPEQKRIADKLDSVLARVDACRDRLDRLPALLKRFRQSILAAATSGRLTEDWRVGQEISWEEVHLSDIGEFGRGKSKHRPRNDPRLYGGPHPFVQTGDVTGSEGVIRKHTQTYSDFGLAQSKLWPAGTLCITIAANIADTAILSYPACFPDSIVGFSPDESKCSAHFVKWVIDVIKEDLERFAPATAQKNINLGILSEIAFKLPSLPEQTEIVRRVEILFAFADRLEARLASARRQVGQLTPALLAKAFRGELVAQDPADEPAAELLKRIAAQREVAPKVKRGRAKG